MGLSLGPVPLTPWVFGVTAGVFLYVALVDMVRGGGCRETKGSGQVWRGESQPLCLHWEPPEGWQGRGWGEPLAHQHLRYGIQVEELWTQSRLVWCCADLGEDKAVLLLL